MDKIASRAFPAFAVGFSLFYAPAYCFTKGTATFSWPLFTYFPEINTWRLFLMPGSDTIGPPMWWYGWIASATLVGLAFAIVSLALPGRTMEKIWSILVWLVPIVAFVFLANWERVWFS